MFKYALYLLVQLCTVSAIAQGSFRGVVKNKMSGQPLAGATVKAAGNTILTDAQGMFVIGNVPVGSLSITISFTGFQSLTTSVALPDSSTPVFYLEAAVKTWRT